MKHQILTHTHILQKIRRMAFQIYENNFQEQEIVFVGINGFGYALAQMLEATLREISPIHTQLGMVQINKQEPLLQEVALVEIAPENIADKPVVLVDDVLNTGKTLAYSLKPFLKANIAKLQIAVLVDRNHRLFPVSADFVGYALATTLQEHISVEQEGEAFAVYLS
ncbi:MAG: phosphoribosyltransferase [Bacteroidetes bacterium]|nr:MAG: phosphoribosyltransferase [Bacteroidota bacterium]